MLGAAAGFEQGSVAEDARTGTEGSILVHGNEPGGLKASGGFGDGRAADSEKNFQKRPPISREWSGLRAADYRAEPYIL